VSLDALLVRVIGGAPAAAQPGGARAAAA
jgi:hypothetical protein